MMFILNEEQKKTDLTNLAVLSRVGLKIASATSAELDADATSASSTALIDLGLRLSEATHHGALIEIILHNASGYSILMAINDEYIAFGGLSNVHRIGYYLGYLQELTKKLNIIISGGEVSEKTLSLQEEEKKKIEKQQKEEEVKATATKIPSAEQDKAAMDEMLTYLDDWDKEEKELMGVEEEFEDLEAESNIVSIPKSMTVGIPKDSVDSSISIPEEAPKEIVSEQIGKFKVYKDEVPPVPLDDYTPMEIEEKTGTASEYNETPTETKIPKKVEKQLKPSGPIKPPEKLPSLNELSIPDFGSQSASEYDIEFILKEESEALDSVLKDLGWEEED